MRIGDIKKSISVESKFIQECFDIQRNGYINIIGIVAEGSRTLGAGKSMFSLSLASILDDDFTIDNVIFQPNKQLDEFINRGSCCIVLDDAQYHVPARGWMTRENKRITRQISVMRPNKVDLIYNAPKLSMVDKNIVDITQHLVIMKERGIGYIERVIHKPKQNNREYEYIETLELPLPDKSLIKKYESKRMLFAKK